MMDRYWMSTVAFAALDDDPNFHRRWQGSYPPELRKPDIVILLTVDEENRRRRMQERGESFTPEERTLAADLAGREAVLRIYRLFDPVEINTSQLNPNTVLKAVLAELDGKVVLP